ncbi:hypothetical protein LCGC14_1341740 [marine sediment metagenome]|uniref:Siphovirus-type tail component C-terminal domain-containing protein n=1 Tax=marine sediment metagenome TaxID=412755 RepID=A0A0F9KE75_9ZZZZ
MDKFYIIPDSGAGGLIDISDNEFYAVGPGMRGHDMPPHVQLDIKLPVDPGSAHVTTQIGTRRVFTPLLIGGSTPVEFREKKNDLIVGTYNQQVVFRFDRDDTPARDLYCRYVSGLEGGLQKGKTWLNTVLVVTASDPFYYANSLAVSKDFTVGEAQLTLPWPPVRVAAGQLAEDMVETNVGEVLSWPVWELHGPFTYAKLEHVDLGKSFEITATIAEGEIIDIDTRTLIKTVEDRTTGDNFWDLVSPGGEMFPIVPGVNNMSVTLNDATLVSKVSLAYTPRFLRA